MVLGEEYFVAVSETGQPCKMQNIAPTIVYLLRAISDVRISLLVIFRGAHLQTSMLLGKSLPCPHIPVVGSY